MQQHACASKLAQRSLWNRIAGLLAMVVLIKEFHESVEHIAHVLLSLIGH